MTQQNKEVLEKVQNTSEKKRISLLVNKYTSVNSKLDSLKKFCNQLLLRSGRRRVLISSLLLLD